MRILRVVAVLALSLILAAHASAEQPDAPAPTDAAIRAAATKALALVQKSVTAWDSKQTCFSCHHQGLAIAALRTARERGVPFDETAAQKSTARVFRNLANIDLAVQAVQQIDPALSSAFWLTSAAAAGRAPNLTTAVYARTIAARQEPDGRWVTIDARPPQAYSQVTATALSLRAIQLHLPDVLAAERTKRVDRARAWLRGVQPADTEDRAFQLLGLVWSGESGEALTPLADRLVAEQRSDGGWAQLPSRASDAYATGQALVALDRVDATPAIDAARRRGRRYLLETQLADGSWLVRTRVHEQDLLSPPYFETGYPHGRDQFSSLNGAAWAAMALMRALPVVAAEATVLPPLTVAVQGGPSGSEPAWMKAALFGTVDELKALLDGGLDANSRTTAGTTLLMMAAHDPAKARLLLARGADARATSQARHTALMVAANQRGAIESMRLLLDAGAPAAPAAGNERRGRGAGVSPMLYAIWSGEPEKVALLLDRGATLPHRMSIGGGIFLAAPLEVAVFLRDIPMVKLLVARGARLDTLGELGITPLISAVLGDDVAMVRALIALGADVNQVDQQGETALMHAAQIDFGNTAVADALLAAGANRSVASPDKLTARELADKYGHASLAARLR